MAEMLTSLISSLNCKAVENSLAAERTTFKQIFESLPPLNVTYQPTNYKSNFVKVSLQII